MHFDERTVGECRIYAGAMERPHGYAAAVVVKRVKGVTGCPEMYRDEALSDGHPWPTPQEALQHAMARGCEVADDEQQLQAA